MKSETEKQKRSRLGRERYLASRERLGLGDQHARVSNASLLDYIEEYSVACPKRYSKVKAYLTERKSTRGAALSTEAMNYAPLFFKNALGLVQGNPATVKRTIVYGISNECPVCSKPMSKPGRSGCSRTCRANNPEIRLKMQETTLENYGVSHHMQNKTVVKNRADKYFEKHGVENPQQLAEIREKTIKTNLERYGSSNALMNPEVKAKGRATLLKNHGVTNPGQSPEIRAKREATSMKKWGVHCNLKSNESKDKIVATNMRKRGVRNAMQSPETFMKQRASGHARKVFVEKNGKVHDTLQGYEPRVMKYLNDRGVENFATSPSKNPVLRYGPDDRIYFPDMRFKSPKGEKFLLEVKSTRTLTCEWQMNIQKFKAANAWCADHGYTFMVAIGFEDANKKPMFVKNPTASALKSAISKHSDAMRY